MNARHHTDFNQRLVKGLEVGRQSKDFKKKQKDKNCYLTYELFGVKNGHMRVGIQ
jgi:hypothetical protein